MCQWLLRYLSPIQSVSIFAENSVEKWWSSQKLMDEDVLLIWLLTSVRGRAFPGHIRCHGGVAISATWSQWRRSPLPNSNKLETYAWCALAKTEPILGSTVGSQLTCRCCCCSVALLCQTLCGPTDCSTPGFPVLHHIPELAQTHVHQVCDAVQPSHSLTSPSPRAFNLSQHQGLFQWISSSHQVAEVLEFQLQSASVLPMNIQDWFPLGLTGWISLQSNRLSRVFWTQQFNSINSSALSLLCDPTLTSIHDYWRNYSFD